MRTKSKIYCHFVARKKKKEEATDSQYLKLTSKSSILSKKISHFPSTNTNLLWRKILQY